MSNKLDNAIGSETTKNDQGAISRRGFVKGTTTMAAVAAAVSLEPWLGGKGSRAEASVINYGYAARAQASLNYRVNKSNDEYVDLWILTEKGVEVILTE